MLLCWSKLFIKLILVTLTPHYLVDPTSNRMCGFSSAEIGNLVVKFNFHEALLLMVLDQELEAGVQVVRATSHIREAPNLLEVVKGKITHD